MFKNTHDFPLSAKTTGAISRDCGGAAYLQDTKSGYWSNIVSLFVCNLSDSFSFNSGWQHRRERLG
tara:strand:- start:656 stop:853 length:198 start_codon:yes stop_codon:yes gene_type:complete